VKLGEEGKNFSGKVLSLFPKPHHPFLARRNKMKPAPNLLLAFIFLIFKKINALNVFSCLTPLILVVAKRLILFANSIRGDQSYLLILFYCYIYI